MVVFYVLALVSVAVEAHTTVRMRGTITAFDGAVLALKSHEGRERARPVSHERLCNSIVASCKSGVSNPSVNHP
jgi:hypothetical protein